MTYKEVNTMIASMGLDYAYNHFPKDTEHAPPFICFLYGNSNDMLADNTNYSPIRELSIELYTDNKDFTLEATVESTLSSNELVYRKSETYIESELMYMVVYDTEFVVTEETEVNNG